MSEKRERPQPLGEELFSPGTRQERGRATRSRSTGIADAEAGLLPPLPPALLPPPPQLPEPGCPCCNCLATWQRWQNQTAAVTTGTVGPVAALLATRQDPPGRRSRGPRRQFRCQAATRAPAAAVTTGIVGPVAALLATRQEPPGRPAAAHGGNFAVKRQRERQRRR
ncbi:hypothetical protein HXX76_008614 [Chlamydomonas incerta]|uniref:Uncharacterized protein n=1 Tax=Chlamydomonas incerta TaxID=51695 RepID=A0A835W0P2_CHLIN|nr:hypothetical protein HXX76_008614 [Chlamydomonas incerta]|eukprot:KAG2432883.1 hypothetical protein HXX76_008614 [Chlamydomonas incerta]